MEGLFGLKTRFQEHELLPACRTLFGPDVQFSSNFFENLQTGEVKTAFRDKVKQNHPDLFADQDLNVQSQQAASFRDLLKAFHLIREFLRQRDEIHHPAATGPATVTEQFYRGQLPLRRLEFGSFLYYRGIISYQTLTAALTWQRRQRPALGDLARRWKWLNDNDILRICRNRSVYGRFGEKAVQLGLLTGDQVRALLTVQQTQQQKIGRFFVEAGLLSTAQVETLVKEMQQHNLRFEPPPNESWQRATNNH